MLEKDSYSQQDIDYTFDLQEKEKNGAESPIMSRDHIFASDIYKSLFFEKIFSGMTKRFTKAADEMEGQNKYTVSNWLDRDMAKCVENKQEEMTKILLGLAKKTKDPTEETLLSELWNIIGVNWIENLYPQPDEKEKKLRDLLREAWKNMDSSGKLGQALMPSLWNAISKLPKKENPA